MSEDSHATAPSSDEHLDAEDFTTILKGIGMSTVEAKKTKDARGNWHTLMSDSADEMTQNLCPTCDRKITQLLKFTRFYMKFERASTHDMSNLTTSPSKQS